MPFTLLLVDDNQVQAATRQAILATSGIKAFVTHFADKALDLLQSLSTTEPVQLVITDHLMPGMNGPKFVSKLREQFPTLPVLVLSGLPDAEMEYEGLRVVYRLKPIDPEELIRLVQSLCDEPLGRTA
jgi:CheY-like chemotaxis protein